MQIKTTMRYHLTPTRMATVKKKKKEKQEKFSGGLVVRIPTFTAVAQVQSLIGELRFCTPCNATKKKKKERKGKKNKTENNKCQQGYIQKMELLYTVGRNVKWFSLHGKQCGNSSKKIKHRITIYYDPANPLLGIKLKKLKAGSGRDILYPFHDSIIHNSQNVEATLMSING